MNFTFTFDYNSKPKLTCYPYFLKKFFGYVSEIPKQKGKHLNIELWILSSIKMLLFCNIELSAEKLAKHSMSF